MSWHCPQIDKALPAYQDGSLPEPQRRLVVAHLHRCPTCRQRLDSLNRATQALENWKPVPAPPDALVTFRARLVAQQDASSRRMRGFTLRPAWLLPATVTAILAILFLSPKPPCSGPVGSPPRRTARSDPSPREVLPTAPSPLLDAASPNPSRATPGRSASRKTAAPATQTASKGRRDSSRRFHRAHRPGALPPGPAAFPGPPNPTTRERHVHIAGQTIQVLDSNTGELRHVIVTRVVDSATGQVHVTLVEPAVAMRENEETGDG